MPWAAVRKAFVKTDSIGSVVTLGLPFERVSSKKIRIRLEIDINPPQGSSFETSYLSFPTTAPLTTQTLPSGFGTKTHALLCRRYVKGRDWYDFLWYVARRTVPDLALLGNALLQQGPCTASASRSRTSGCSRHCERRSRVSTGNARQTMFDGFFR